MTTALNKSQILAEAAPKIERLLKGQTQLLQILPTSVSKRIPPPTTSKRASILVPIIHVNTSNGTGDQIPSILFTTRSSQLKDHANQISFPGGHVDEIEDNNCVVSAALRETKEELSPPPQNSRLIKNPQKYDFRRGIEVLGQTESVPSIRNVPVTPVVGIFKEEFTADDVQRFFPGNESEVSQVFTVPIDELIRIEKEEPLKRLGMSGPVYHTDFGKIWGLTSIVLKPILDQILKPVFIK